MVRLSLAGEESMMLAVDGLSANAPTDKVHGATPLEFTTHCLFS